MASYRRVSTPSSAEPTIPFFVPSITEIEQRRLMEVLESGWLTSGPEVSAFEQEFAERVGAAHAVAVNSCTAAMHLALVAADVGPGDEVIVPTLTFTATAEVVVHAGARPVLVDVDPRTLSLCPESVAAARTDRTRAVMPMHYGGQACDLDAVRAAVGSEVAIVADGAHAFPTGFGDRMIGGDGIADATAFSFYANKTITTGEGGMVTTDDEQLADRVRRLSLHGLSDDAWHRFETRAPWDYDVLEAGYKYNLTDLSAALGRAQLGRADELADRRRALARRYQALLDPAAPASPVEVADPERSSWHLFAVRLDLDRLDCDRNTIVSDLSALGIGTSVHYRPLHLHTWYRQQFDYERDDFPVAADAFDRLISLPLYPDLAPESVDRVVEAFSSVLGHHTGSAPSARVSPLPESADDDVVRAERVYLSPPDVRDSERKRLLAAVEGNWIAPIGPDLDEFEEELIRLSDMPHAVALSSGTGALHLALEGVGVGPGDDVLVPSFTFVATANPVTYLGARPVFIDSERRSWNMSPELLADELSDRAEHGRLPVAVIVVDLYGQCADYDSINEICGEYGIPVVEDAAEAVGSSYRGRPAGSLAELGVFSFNGNKLITTGGGGAVVTRDRELRDRIHYLATQARQPAPHYEHTEFGYNYRLSNLLAAFGLGQLDTLSDRIERTREIRDRYRSRLAEVPGLEIPLETDWGRSNAWLTCLTLDPETALVDREQLRLHLESANIEARPLWKPLHLQPVFRDHEARVDGTAESLFDIGLCLPSGSGMTDDDQDRVIDAILAVST